MKIYSAPKEIKLPDYDFRDINSYHKEVTRYIDEVKDYVIKDNDSKYAGEIIHFPVADGYAQYMIVSMKPLSSIHLEIDDCYEFEYIERLTSRDVLKKLEQQEALRKIFSK